MIHACETPDCLRSLAYLKELDDADQAQNDGSSSFYLRRHRPRFYVGVDVARKHDLTVIDVGEKVGDILWDRMRIELQNKKFSEMEEELFAILRLPCVIRCCIDATGIGMQLAERAKDRFGWKVEPVHFTAAIKEELAFELRMAFEDRRLRIDPSPKLREDLRGVQKFVTSAGNIRFLAENDDSHCDRFWAKALRQHAAQSKGPWVGAVVC
jgi:phage FluMu gp28-like protein